MGRTVFRRLHEARKNPELKCQVAKQFIPGRRTDTKIASMLARLNSGRLDIRLTLGSTLMATLIVALNSGSLGLLRELAKSTLEEKMPVKIVSMSE